MQTQKRIITKLQFLLFLLFYCCSGNKPVSSSDNENVLIYDDIKPNKLNNIFIVDEEYCDKNKLLYTQFKIEYPDSVYVEFASENRDTNFSYINFIKYDNNKSIMEYLSLGVHVLSGINIDDVFCDILLNKQLEIYRNKTELVDSLYYGTQSINNYNFDLLLFKYKAKKTKDFFYSFNFSFLPTKGNFKAGVSVNYELNEKTGVTGIEDFGKIGVISQVLSTFEFVDKKIIRKSD